MLLGFHGGKCCGIRHLFGFGNFDFDYGAHVRNQYAGVADSAPAQQKLTWYVRGTPSVSTAVYQKPVAETMKQEFLNIMEWAAQRQNMMYSKCIEVVFTDSQFSSTPQWAQLLKDHGFEFKTRFRNNGSSWCNVFHKVVDPKYEDKNPPKWWTALKKTEVVEEQEAA